MPSKFDRNCGTWQIAHFDCVNVLRSRVWHIMVPHDELLCWRRRWLVVFTPPENPCNWCVHASFFLFYLRRLLLLLCFMAVEYIQLESEHLFSIVCGSALRDDIHYSTKLWIKFSLFCNCRKSKNKLGLNPKLKQNRETEGKSLLVCILFVLFEQKLFHNLFRCDTAI